MYRIAKLSSEDRSILFQNSAAKFGVNVAIIEKDFWVCLTLDYLFQHCKWKQAFACKGGTSLSKVYGLIERFSEDIDLILDWRTIGYSCNEPWAERSNTQQQKFIEDSEKRTFQFLKNDFLPIFKADLSDLLSADINSYIDTSDPAVIRFAYPHVFKNSSILQEIRLEIGALAAWTPTQFSNIQSYAAECYPSVFQQASTRVLTTTVERTFWEKATILHQEAHRPETSKVPERYSRHYYDFYCMANKGVLEKALFQSDLLIQVADFKCKFYPRKWAKYENARIGTLKLVPSSHCINELRIDYEKMKAMIYGDYPDFDTIISFITNLEHEINLR